MKVAKLKKVIIKDFDIIHYIENMLLTKGYQRDNKSNDYILVH